MATLHALYTPHSYSIAGRLLFEKLNTMYQQGIHPAFVACEWLRDPQNQGNHQALFDSMRDQMQHILHTQGKSPIEIDPMWIEDNLREKERQIRQLNEEAKKRGQEPVSAEEEIHEELHLYGLALAAAAFDTPIHFVEKTGSERIRKIGEHIKRMDTFKIRRNMTPLLALKRLRQQFNQDVRANTLRHKTVAKNLFHLFREPNDHGILIFGSGHVGMEQDIAKRLKKRGITLELSTQLEDPRHDFYSRLCQSAWQNPSFLPSNKDLAAALLDSAISNQLIQPIRIRLAQEYGMDLSKPDDEFYANELAKSSPEYVESMKRVRSRLSAMQEKRLKYHIANLFKGNLNLMRLTRERYG